MGDGTLTKYFISISGDSRYDLQYFNYISDLIKELFGLSAKIRVDKRGNTLILTVHSVKLCSLLNEYGFKYGDKIRNNSFFVTAGKNWRIIKKISYKIQAHVSTSAFYKSKIFFIF